MYILTTQFWEKIMYILTTLFWKQLSKSWQLSFGNKCILTTHFEDKNVHPDNSLLETLTSWQLTFGDNYILKTHFWRHLRPDNSLLETIISWQLTFGNNYVHSDKSLWRHLCTSWYLTLKIILYILTAHFEDSYVQLYILTSYFEDNYVHPDISLFETITCVHPDNSLL